MIAISTKGMKIIKGEYKGKEQESITLGLSNGKYPAFNVMKDGVACVARVVPSLNESTNVWELRMVFSEAPKAEVSKPKEATSFKASEVAKVGDSRIDKLEAMMALVLERLPSK